ncbi:hypothetical protein [Geomicrobium sediminis]|uniref:Uncharacterized protein n=1 Tax=Geomicrobium sediminis TaxID=1347788 RepID=A0ABS2PA01_9BACL|nr:hypothetical protein [Geomicrobium sediminis]MBM7632253.1 hypothetical protein [Geomicrobium sediminis]
MRTKIIYNLDEGKEEKLHIVESEQQIFIPESNDVFILNGWGYHVSRREFAYNDGNVEVTVFCYREKKKRS